MNQLRAVTLLLSVISCRTHDEGRDPKVSTSTSAPHDAPNFAAPRIGKVVPSTAVDKTFDEHGGAFALDFRRSAKLLADGSVLVCDGPRLLRLTSDGRPDSSFGRGGVVGLGGDDLECKEVLPVATGEAYVRLGSSSP